MSAVERSAAARSGSTADVCPACGSREASFERAIDVAVQHSAYFPADAGTQQLLNTTAAPASQYTLMRCRRCALTFASPMAAPGSRWYEVAYRALHVRPEQRWEYDVVLRAVTPRDVVHEIGCGTGVFLDACRARRIAACGIDFSSDAVDACRRRGLAVERVDVGLTEDLGGLAGTASVVASFHVLEHLERPHELFRRAHAAAREGAVLWISVPSASRVSRICGLEEPLDDPPHHLTKWTESALRELGSRTGWTLDALTFEPFSWRAALWSVASHFTLYRSMQASGRLHPGLLEKTLRAFLYPFAFVRLLGHPERRRMSGFSMIARYRRASSLGMNGRDAG